MVKNKSLLRGVVGKLARIAKVKSARKTLKLNKIDGFVIKMEKKVGPEKEKVFGQYAVRKAGPVRMKRKHGGYEVLV